MNKKNKTIILLGIWIIILLYINLINLDSSIKYVDWFDVQIGEYEVRAEQKLPLFPFEKTRVQVWIKMGKKYLEFETEINGYKKMNDKNYNLEVDKDHIVLEFINFDGNIERIYRVYKEDFE